MERYVSFFLNGEAPMKSYSWHGASPQVSWCPSDQNGVPHFEQIWRVKPCLRNSSTSYSPSGISVTERAVGLKGSRDALAASRNGEVFCVRVTRPRDDEPTESCCSARFGRRALQRTDPTFA